MLYIVLTPGVLNSQATVTGITISPVQRDMAEKIAQEEGVADSTQFFCMDGENMTFDSER